MEAGIQLFSPHSVLCPFPWDDVTHIQGGPSHFIYTMTIGLFLMLSLWHCPYNTQETSDPNHGFECGSYTHAKARLAVALPHIEGGMDSSFLYTTGVSHVFTSLHL